MFVFRRVAILVLLALVALALVAASADARYRNLRQAPTAVLPSAATQGEIPPYAEGQLIVRFKQGVSESRRAAVRSRRKATLLKQLKIPRTELLAVDATKHPRSLARAFARESEVEYAEPNYTRRLAATFPNDPQLAEQWALGNYRQSTNGVAGNLDADMDVPEAWDEVTASSEVTVGVVDTGVDYNHPDIASNIWTNSGEIGDGKEDNGFDDDGNGYADDWRGWNFYGSPSFEESNDPNDVFGHGTYIAGLVGARGNDGSTIAGVNWSVALAALRACNEQFCFDADIAEAFAYAGAEQMQVVVAAISGSQMSNTVKLAIDGAPNTLFVVPAANGGDNFIGDNIELSPEFPCAFTSPNILCVAATDQSDRLAYFSNYGTTSVDVAAPGVNALGLWKTNRLAYLDGTSAASGYGGGAAALVFAHDRSSSVATIKSRLMNNTDPIVDVQGQKLVTNGRLNVAKAIPPPAAAAEGSLDTTFDVDGIAQTAFNEGVSQVEARDVAVQRDGKIVVAGEDSSENDFAVARYNRDGSLDTTFGGDGRVTTHFGGVEEALAVTIDFSGRIVLAGSGNAGFLIARYNTDGSLDTSFDGDGWLTTTFPVGGSATARDVRIDSAGRIVAAGYTVTPAFYMTVARYESDGSLDSTFSGDGRAEISGAEAYALAIDSSDRVVLSGRLIGKPDFAVTRLDTNGVLDSSFGGDGIVQTDFGDSFTPTARDLLIQPDGRIVAVGYSQNLSSNGRIAFHGRLAGETDDEIYTIQQDGQGLLKLTNNAENDFAADLSPDGNKIVFAREVTGVGQQLFTMNTDGSDQTQIGSMNPDVRVPAWSPDGSKIAYQSMEDGDWEIKVSNVDGSGQVQLTTNTTIKDEDPNWSPDGSKLAFYSDRDGNDEIWIINSDGSGTPTQLTTSTSPVFNRGPNWSPDGTKIAYTSTADGDEDLYVRNADGTGTPTQLTNVAGNDREPNWSPDGTRIAFDTTRVMPGRVDIWRMDANGSNPQSVQVGPTAGPAWGYQLPSSGPVFVLARYTASGALDSTFGSGGKSAYDFQPGGHFPNAAALQPNGKIVVAGWASSGENFAVARYGRDGSLDTSFDGDGWTVTGGTNGYEVAEVAIQRDGKILVSGGDSFTSDFAVARYNATAPAITVTADTELDPNGQNVTVTGTGFDPGSTVALDQCNTNFLDCSLQGQPVANGAGAFTTQIELDLTGDDGISACALDDCEVRASGVPAQATASAPISFTSTPSLESHPSAGVIALQQSIVPGTPVTLAAELTGDAVRGSPTGTVSFFVCGPIARPSSCRTGANLTGNPVSLSPQAANKATATSGTFTPSTHGRYCFRTVYSGDGLYRAASDAAKEESCINVREVSPVVDARDDYALIGRNSTLVEPFPGVAENDTWPGGEGITVSIPPGEGPDNGILIMQPDGSFTYTPNTGFFGFDTFTYQLTSPTSSDTATMEIEVSQSENPLEGTRFRGTRFRGTRFREIDLVSLQITADCGPRFVSVYPQVTIPQVTFVQMTAALYDTTGQRLAASDFLVNEQFYGDPFSPTVLTWPEWTTPAPPDGAYVEVIIKANPGTQDEYTASGSVLCAT